MLDISYYSRKFNTWKDNIKMDLRHVGSFIMVSGEGSAVPDLRAIVHPEISLCLQTDSQSASQSWCQAPI
jgi:hypothetical protein